MKETEIRPKHFTEGQKLAMIEDVSRLLSRHSEFINVSCPACGQNNALKKFEKYCLGYFQCKNCETLYINPRPTSEILDWFYKESANYQYWNKFIFPASEEVRKKQIFIPRVDRVLQICEKLGIVTDSLLEIGCAYGTFCQEMKLRNKFKRIVGVEPTPDLAETSRNKGIDIIENSIENIQFSEEDKFNVIVSFEVIEHLFSPRDLVIQLKSLLNPDGLLIMTCPNGKGFDFTVLGDKCNSIDYEHLNYFNPKSIAFLLESCGFEVLESITPGKLDAELVRNKIIEESFDISNQPFLEQVLIDEWAEKGEIFQQFISSSGLSSHMWVVAKRK